jgi:hypothetical protein
MPDETPEDKRARLQALRERIQAKLKEPKDRRWRAASPPPRYDEVFFRGVAWLNSLAEGGDSMLTVYVAGPFRGKDGYEVYRNVQRAEALMYEAIKATQEAGIQVAFMCPHSMTFHFDRTFNDPYWLAATLEWLRRSDAILLTGDWERSEGVRGEKAEAERTGKKVCYTVQELVAWAKEAQAA